MSRGIENREFKWWQEHREFSDKHGLSSPASDELLELIIDAIHEAGAAELGSLGGTRRAKTLTKERRIALARSAAKARWERRP